MPVNYAKEYLMFVQTGVVFLPFHVRVKNGRHYSNFEKKNLKFEIYIIFNTYFQKITVFLWFSGTGFALVPSYVYFSLKVTSKTEICLTIYEVQSAGLLVLLQNR